MRTNLAIDDDVLDPAMKAGSFKTKQDAVETGSRLIARQAAYREILRGEGTLRWDADDAADGVTADGVVRATGERPGPAAAMLVVDASVWIDFFTGAPSPARATLRRLLGDSDGDTEIVVPDPVLCEVQVAAFCIDRGDALLHVDRDVDASEATRGLRAWRH